MVEDAYTTLKIESFFSVQQCVMYSKGMLALEQCLSLQTSTQHSCQATPYTQTNPLIFDMSSVPCTDSMGLVLLIAMFSQKAVEPIYYVVGAMILYRQ